MNMTMIRPGTACWLICTSVALLSVGQDCRADEVVADDLIVQGSLAVGLDAVVGQDFGFDTLRLQENNVRILFDDTSVTAGFSMNDWRIIINGDGSGAENFFAIEDSTATTTPFKISAGAPTGSFRVDNLGNLGLKTTTPALDIHVVSGNTPAMRLEQNVSAGFTAQTWDVGANDDNFFIRDVTGGNRLPFRIKPGAPSDSFVIGTGGNVGIGTDDPQKNLHVINANAAGALRLQDSSATPGIWDVEGSGMGFDIKDVDGGTTPFSILPDAPTDSLFVAANGSIGFGTNQPNQLGAANGAGRFFNIRAGGATAATGVANGAFQGQLGAQNHFVHLGAPANARIMRLQTSSGFTGFHALNDNLTTYAVKSILMMNMTNGNVGFKRDAPAHPIHMASGAHVTAGGVWTNASSRELKQDIQPITSEQARDAVRTLEPVSYRYKNELDEQYAGFIAEDVPELVATNDRKCLAAMDITAVLTRVVQDQDKLLAEEREKNARQERALADERQRNDWHEKLIESLTRRLNALEQARESRHPAE